MLHAYTVMELSKVQKTIQHVTWPKTVEQALAEWWHLWEHVTLSERLNGDTDRHHYTLSCFHSLSMKCHSVFIVLSLCLGWAVLLHFTILSLHFTDICLYFPALPFFILTLWLPSILSTSFFSSYPYPCLFVLYFHKQCKSVECIGVVSIAFVRDGRSWMCTWWGLQVSLSGLFPSITDWLWGQRISV